MECKYCGKKFIKNSNIQKFCSGKCREKHYLDYNKKYYLKNKILKKPIVIICPECGKEKSTIKNNQKFCSQKCACINWRKNNKEKSNEINKKSYLKNIEKRKKQRRIYCESEKGKNKINEQRKKYYEKYIEYKSENLFEDFCPVCGEFGYFVKQWVYNKKTKSKTGKRIFCFHKKKGPYDICTIAQNKKDYEKFMEGYK